MSEELINKVLAEVVKKMEKMNIMGTFMIKQMQQYMSIISKIVSH